MQDEASPEHVEAQTSAAATPDRRVALVRGRRGWHSLELKRIWEYRELVFFLIWRDITTRYRQTALGPLWIVLKPIVQMVVFTVIFSGLAKVSSEGLPYPVFSFTALLPWGLFVSAATASTASLVSGMGMISRVYFPRLIMPLVAICQGLEDFVVQFVILIVLMCSYHVAPVAAITALPFYVLLATCSGLAIGLWLAGVAVRFRDVTLGLGYLLQAAMLLSPVIYPASEVLKKWPGVYPIYMLNPMTNVIEGFRWALLGTGTPPGMYLVVSTLLVLVMLVTGLYNFRQTERTIVDVR